MLHTVSITKDNIISVEMVGMVSTVEAFEVGKRVLTSITEMEDAGRPVRVLLDYARIGDMADKDCLRATAKIYGILNETARLALVSTNDQYSQENLEAIRLAKKESIYAVFENREDAVSWLLL